MRYIVVVTLSGKDHYVRKIRTDDLDLTAERAEADVFDGSTFTESRDKVLIYLARPIGLAHPDTIEAIKFEAA